MTQHVFTREDGSQVLVEVYTHPDTLKTMVRVAERASQYDSWGPPMHENTFNLSGRP